jgi:hypothetical protein
MDILTTVVLLKKVFSFVRTSRHYLLAGINLIINAANIGLLYSVFGSGIETAAYFISTNGIAACNLLLLTFVEQFAFLFSSRCTLSKDAAESFFWSVMWSVIVLGTFVWVIVYANVEYVIKLYSPGLQGLNYTVAVSMAKILSISIITTTPLYLVQQKLGCHGMVSWSYLVSILPNAILLIGLIVAWFLKQDIYLALVCYAIGSTVIFLSSIFIFRDSLTGFNKGELQNLRVLAWQSAKIRTAHNLHNIVSNYLISLAVGYIPVNLASFFFGVKRSAEALTQIIVGPFVKPLPPIILQSIQNDDFQQLILKLNRNKAQISRFYIVIVIISSIVMLYGQYKWSIFADHLVYYWLTCLTLLCYSWLNSILIPYSMIASGYGRSKVFYRSNTLFCACLCIATMIVILCQEYWVLPVGLLVSQAISYQINMVYLNDIVLRKAGLRIKTKL